MSSGVDKSFPRLLGDIGGTNARFALIRYEGGPVEEIRTLSGADYPGPAEAIEAYLKLAGGERPVAGAIGIANPIDGDSIKMTNHTWAFSIEALRKAVGLTKLIFINDFTALALSLPQLPANELVQVGGKAADRTPRSACSDRAPAWVSPASCLRPRATFPFLARAATSRFPHAPKKSSRWCRNWGAPILTSRPNASSPAPGW